jgi:hypothetical protein
MVFLKVFSLLNLYVAMHNKVKKPKKPSRMNDKGKTKPLPSSPNNPGHREDFDRLLGDALGVWAAKKGG